MNVDHVLITEHAVFAIETKYSSYPWRQRPRTPALDSALRQATEGARKIRLLLNSCGLDVEVTHAVAVWGRAGRDLVSGHNDTALVLLDDLLVSDTHMHARGVVMPN